MGNDVGNFRSIGREVLIGAVVFVKNRGSFLHGVQRIEDRRQLLVFHLDKPRGFFGYIRVFSGHRRDFFSNESHPVPG